MPNNLPKNYEIVVAHYSEDLEWLKPYAKNTIVYHKWKEDKPRLECKKRIKIDNIWREWHTYLYHIVNNYDNLPEYTFFFQWWIEDHKQSWDVYNSLEKYFSETQKPFSNGQGYNNPASNQVNNYTTPRSMVICILVIYIFI